MKALSAFILGLALCFAVGCARDVSDKCCDQCVEECDCANGNGCCCEGECKEECNCEGCCCQKD